MKKCHIFLLSLISLLSPFYHANPFSRPTWLGGKVTAKDAKEEFDDLDKKLEKLTGIFIQDSLIGGNTSDTIAHNQKADKQYQERKKKDQRGTTAASASATDATDTPEEVTSSPNATPRYPESATQFFAHERRETTEQGTNEVEKPFDLRALLNIIEKQQDNLKKYKRLRFKTRMAKLEEDIAEAQKKYSSFDGIRSESDHTLADIASTKQTLHTRLSNAFQYNVQIAYTYYKLQRRRPTTETSSSKKESEQTKEVNNDDKGALKTMYELVADISKGSAKRLKEHDLQPLSQEALNDAYAEFKRWLTKLKLLCGETQTTEESTQSQKYQDPFEVDLFNTATYYSIPLKDVLGTYKNVSAYLVQCAESIKEFTKTKNLFPCAEEQNPSKPQQKIDKLEGWPTNLFAVLAAYHDKLFLGGFSIIGTRWLLLNTILKEVASQTNGILSLLGVSGLNISFATYKETLGSLCNARQSTPSDNAGTGDSTTDTQATTTSMLRKLAESSFYRTWDTTGIQADTESGSSGDAGLSKYGQQAKKLQEQVIEAVGKLSPEKKKTLTSLRLQATIKLAHLHARHASFIAENAIIAIRKKDINPETQFVHPEDTRAYLELKVTEIAVYNLIALIKVTGQKQLYDKEAHKKMRSGDLNNALPYLFRNLEPLATSHAQMHTTAKLNDAATHDKPEKAAIKSLNSLAAAIEKINAYESARNTRPNGTDKLKKLLDAAAAAILAQLSAAVRTAITASNDDLSTLKTRLKELTTNPTELLIAPQGSPSFALTDDEARAIFKSSAVKIQLFTRSLKQLQKVDVDTVADYRQISDPADTIIGTLRQTKVTSEKAATGTSAAQEGAATNVYTITENVVTFSEVSSAKKLTIVDNDNTPTADVQLIRVNPDATTKLRYLVTRQNGKTFFGNALLDANNQPFPPDENGAITVILDAQPAKPGDTKKFTQAIYRAPATAAAPAAAASPVTPPAPMSNAPSSTSGIDNNQLYTLSNQEKIYLTSNGRAIDDVQEIYAGTSGDEVYYIRKGENGPNDNNTVLYKSTSVTPNREYTTVTVDTTTPITNSNIVSSTPLWPIRSTTSNADNTDAATPSSSTNT